MKREIIIKKPEVRKSKSVRLSDINTAFIEELSQSKTVSFSDALNAVIEYVRFDHAK